MRSYGHGTQIFQYNLNLYKQAGTKRIQIPSASRKAVNFYYKNGFGKLKTNNLQTVEVSLDQWTPLVERRKQSPTSSKVPCSPSVQSASCLEHIHSADWVYTLPLPLLKPLMRSVPSTATRPRSTSLELIQRLVIRYHPACPYSIMPRTYTLPMIIG